MIISDYPTITDSSGYRMTAGGWTFLPINRARVKGPILPTYMVRIITIFPKYERCGVTPTERPTVPNAETASNIREPM